MVTARKLAPANLKLSEEREDFRAKLLGPMGYGMPVRIKSYPLVGSVKGDLERLFDRNDHPRAEGTFTWPDADKLAWRQMSGDFWERMGPHYEAFWEEKTLRYINDWCPRPGLVIRVYRGASGQYYHFPEREGASRLFLTMRSDKLRMLVTTADAEQKARKALLKELSARQRRELLLTGAFVEVGRSGVYYRITFNRPTLAYRQRPLEDRVQEVSFLAGLCLHPWGYYEDTFTGCMPPSDEMLTHLKMIRSGEHFFWRKAVQHQITDPLSGL